MAERLRGRRGVEQRRRRLQAEPLCRDCKAKGVITAATAPDHIVTLALGGSDDDSNVRCLCPECSLARTREKFGHRARSTIGEDGWPLGGRQKDLREGKRGQGRGGLGGGQRHKK